MTLSPILSAPALIQFHMACALIALVLGPFVIHRAPRDRFHKIAGYVWVISMTCVAVSSLFIPSFGLKVIGHLGPIHGLAFLALWSLWTGMYSIYKRDIARHKAALKGLYWQGLAVAGLVNFIPGRAVNRALFPETPMMGVGVIVIGAVALLAFNISMSRKDRAQRRGILVRSHQVA